MSTPRDHSSPQTSANPNFHPKPHDSNSPPQAPSDVQSMLTPSRALKASWSSTLHLPKSSLPPRPPLPSPYLARCTDDLYAWQATQRANQQPFVLHDGPPYANGGLHVGHALNKILKDIICRFQVSQGRRVHYVPGWDCHGLPIEVKALQALKVSHDAMGPVEIRRAARKLAEKTVEGQKKGFREWAVMGEWDNAYKTMEKSFELRQLGVFQRMVEKGLIYRAHKPVYWSPSSGTALAEAELEYDEAFKSTSAFIRFAVVELSEELKALEGVDPENIGVVIWTTTPWTLPANQAVAVHAELDYAVVTLQSAPQSQLFIAESRIQNLQSLLGEDAIRVVVGGISGAKLAGAVAYLNPFQSGTRHVIHADFVTATSGSGLVHLAPGHGMDDYHVCTKLGLKALAPVDDNGRFTAEAFPSNPLLLQGKSVQADGPSAVLAHLTTLPVNHVIATHDIRHKYPIDWRTKQPVIVRATEQWFADVDGLKDDALAALEDVNFIPEGGKARLSSFIRGRSQWCISRQRAWGVPIPALYRVDGGAREAVMTPETIAHIISVVDARGIDAWWTDAEDEAAWVPPFLEGTYVRGRDTMDVWFDSGTSWALLPERQADHVADVYLEGSDQHRGWFQSSLLTHVAQQQAAGLPVKAPYKTLITHGFTLDNEGRKMSKSLGNVIAPSQIVDGSLLPPVKRKKQKAGPPTYDAMGPDVLRLWVAGSDYQRDVVVGEPVLKAVQQSLHKFRVTFKWLLGALADYTPGTTASTPNAYALIDRIALHQLSAAAHAVHGAYTSYEFFKATNILNRYINLDLSAFYFETLKDRLYTGTPTERLTAQAVLYPIFNELLAMLGPITPLLVEEVWDHAPEAIKREEHPLRRVWQPYGELSEDSEIKTQIEYLMDTHSAVKVAQETARGEKKMGSSLECDVHFFMPPDAKPMAKSLLNEQMKEELASVFVVSKVHVHEKGEVEVVEGVENGFTLGWGPIYLAVVTSPSGHKCVRCWRYLAEAEESLCGRCEGVVREAFPSMLEKA
ncbi:isoleucyl-tRNA synthetase [Trichodelitschia bisporula]|uniref:Isoleucine--tRNA ligase, mitochondrial n=1 Tax=Trichodelitschia bisporula TaxID=703511 RepID=A0A6G1I3M4_9PEZI|nr:isoleucyl-tRNA synthetase [Trichodelitschia bisporula]